jgi:hypothetical protein
MTPEEFSSLDGPAQQAVLAAVLVRNGVEDLHAAGAFDDGQAPMLNRLVRQELFQACTSAQIGGAPHEDYLFELAEGGCEEAGDDFRLLCLSGAASRAVWAFVEAEGLSEDTGEALADAAQVAICNQEEERALLTPLGAPFLFSYISAWEPPELSDDYLKRVGVI